jgi:signal transduction histidine kinase
VLLIVTTALLIGFPLFVLMRLPRAADAPRPSGGIAAVGVSLAAALGLGVLFVARPDATLPVWVGAAWGLPFAFLLLARIRGQWGTLATWLAVAWLSGSAAGGFLWIAHMQARLHTAEAEIAHLGTEADPYLDYLLRQFAERSAFLDSAGEQGVNLLYRSWVASGLAREGYEARITMWLEGRQLSELRLSDAEMPEAFAVEMLPRAAASSEPVLERYTERDFVHYLLLVPLPDGRVISVVTPPRRRLARSTLARFLHPGERQAGVDDIQVLSLVPLVPGEEAHAAVLGHEIHWVRTPTGWRSEAVVPFPEGPAHAHLLVRTAAPWILFARAILVQLLILLVFLALWSMARTLCGDPLGVPATRRRWLRTFRGRLTLALFGFFLVPTVIFGTVAYQALSQEVVRTSTALARRSLELAAAAVPAEPLPALGARVRADLLLYQRGSLISASAPEVLDLGLFQSWLPPSVELAFASAENIEAQEERTLGGHPYLVAYRRVADDGVLAAPIPLASGEIARTQREFGHAFLLIMLLGAGLSVFLALLVGRALSRPIEMLSRAAVAVGGGNLRLRLPEDRPDEFGGVYRAFNRMVKRIRRARAAEVRTARVLAWGEMARQVAHEIKNPLTPIKLAVQHLRRAHADKRPDFPEILDRNVDSILREIDRLGEIARAFARFGTPRVAAGALEPVQLQQVVDETLVLYRGGADGLRYRTEVDPGLPPVLARDGELREVLINLFENAREAVDGGGEIQVVATPTGGGEWVRIDVIDTGVGIPEEQLPRIFEPQFSTRTSGTGLGLAIVRRLVESWGGEITADSRPGEGTTFHLRLRVADGYSRPERNTG